MRFLKDDFLQSFLLNNNLGLQAATLLQMDYKEKEVFKASEKQDHTLEVDIVSLDDSYKHKLYEFLGHGHILGDEPIPDIEFLYQKIQETTSAEALNILRQVLIEHDDDPNYPHEDMSVIRELVGSFEAKDTSEGTPNEKPDMVEYYDSGDSDSERAFYMKLHAIINEYHSPYPEVRAVTSPIDDTSAPVETIRSYIIALVWVIIGSGVNEFFSHRQPSIGLGSSVIQMLMYPTGKLFEKALPDVGFTAFGSRHSLNPGPWGFKEQMFATLIFNVCSGVYVSSNIIVQKMDLFYGQKWISVGYQVLLALGTQTLGFGFAGVLRKLVIYPTRNIWPTILPTIAFNRALLKPESKENIHGWTISRYLFLIVTGVASFLYFWLPNYLFQALSTFNWMTWIAPGNFNLAAITGSVSGLGLNPIPTFDWNIISFNAPLIYPFFSQINQFAGTMIAFFAIAGVYYSNYLWSAFLPINSNSIFDNTGGPYEVQNVVKNGKFDLDAYKQYGPPYYTASNLVIYGAFFALYPFSFCYTIWEDWFNIRKALSGFFELFKNPKGFFLNSNFSNFKDPHSRMMSKYKEAPDWWFYIVLLVSLVFMILCVKVYPAETPVWGIFFAIAINFIFLVPITIISSVTGFSFGLNVIVELIVGYALPGNPNALMTLKALGYNIDGQAETFISDQKLAHYSKIPPRAVFRGQLIGTILQIIVVLCVVNWEISNVEDFCTPHQKSKFTCPGEVTFYSASVLWGAIGPKKVFDDLYPVLRWAFLIGFLLVFPCIAVKKYFPKQTKQFSPTLIIGGMLVYAPYNIAYYWPSLVFSYIFNFFIKRRYLAWWEKYNFILSAGLDTGTAFSAVIIFFAVQYHPKFVDWWGNNVMYLGADGQAAGYQTSLLDPASQPGGYFGLRLGNSTA
jgi:OPT family small oligopeptide transporter